MSDTNDAAKDAYERQMAHDYPERKSLIVVRVEETHATLEVTSIVGEKATKREKQLTQGELDMLGEWLRRTQGDLGLEVPR